MEKITFKGEVETIPFVHHKCPVCESPCNEEIERYVQSELYKMMIDHSYKPKHYNERDSK